MEARLEWMSYTRSSTVMPIKFHGLFYWKKAKKKDSINLKRVIISLREEHW